MKKFVLQFRAKLPNGKYFEQGDQHLPSFLRRVLMFWEVSHPKYLKNNLEEYLEIKIEDEWVQCCFYKD